MTKNIRTLSQHVLFSIFCVILFSNTIAAENSLLEQSSNTSLTTSGLSRTLSDNLQPLPQEEAFRLTLSVNQEGKAVLNWSISEGYYLYNKSLMISSEQAPDISFLDFPRGEIIVDEFFGEVEIYRHTLQIEIDIQSDQLKSESIDFTVSSQGCAENLYCYPIHESQLSLFFN